MFNHDPNDGWEADKLSTGLYLIFDQSNSESHEVKTGHGNMVWNQTLTNPTINFDWLLTAFNGISHINFKFWLYSLPRNLLVALPEKMLDSHVVQQEAWGMVEPCLQRFNITFKIDTGVKSIKEATVDQISIGSGLQMIAFEHNIYDVLYCGEQNKFLELKKKNKQKYTVFSWKITKILWRPIF